jgi:hypothetical protein
VAPPATIHASSVREGQFGLVEASLLPQNSLHGYDGADSPKSDESSEAWHLRLAYLPGKTSRKPLWIIHISLIGRSSMATTAVACRCIWSSQKPSVPSKNACRYRNAGNASLKVVITSDSVGAEFTTHTRSF